MKSFTGAYLVVSPTRVVSSERRSPKIIPLKFPLHLEKDIVDITENLTEPRARFVLQLFRKLKTPEYHLPSRGTLKFFKVRRKLLAGSGLRNTWTLWS